MILMILYVLGTNSKRQLSSDIRHSGKIVTVNDNQAPEKKVRFN